MEALLFDFDGVIIDSVPVRTRGFRQIFEGYPAEAVEALIAYHRINGGISRFVKIRYFFETLLRTPITEAKVQEFAGRYSQIMRSELADFSVIIPETLEFIRRIHGRVRLHIASGSEEQELRWLCETLGIAAFFDSIHGSPTPKTTLVADLMAARGYRREAVCLIGDSINDYEAAEASGIGFFGYNNPELRGTGAGYIEGFAGLDLSDLSGGRYSLQSAKGDA